MSELISFVGHPPLHEPALVVVLEGWIDSGTAAATAMQTILGNSDSEIVATFDTDTLLDHRARRPIMRLVDGTVEDLAWPTIELRALTDENGRHTLVLVGAEPDHHWQKFSDGIIDAALDFGVRSVVGLGAYPAAVPHTRDTQMALTSPSSDVVDAFSGFVRGSVEVPGGIQASIEWAASGAGLSAMALWAQVPHYVSGMAYPAASIALISGLNRVAGLSFGTGELEEEAESTRSHLDELVSGNPQHSNMVEQLEEAYDSSASQYGPLPTGDELAAEFQAFLRDQND
ncbi:MAG: PAC2 family protein [Acidimicrobiia bacterium]|nr:PAC2 family protein [Acidimicrobiia bacterium]